MTIGASIGPRVSAFRHEALLYSGPNEFMESTVGFIREGVAAREPVLVVVAADKIRRLRSALGADANWVLFADMATVGANPARIIPAWREFVDAHQRNGRALRGIGEPISTELSPAALAECQRHEDLLNLAFEDAPSWWLLCPYDVAALPQEVIAEARRSHPYVQRADYHEPSDEYRGLDAITAACDAPLAPPPSDAVTLGFASAHLAAVRRFVDHHAKVAGLSPDRRDDLVFSANELASNSLRYGGGGGEARMWREGNVLVCEISDRGSISDPLAGRIHPEPDKTSGRGLWLVNYLSDLTQVRSTPEGTVIRLHMECG